MENYQIGGSCEVTNVEHCEAWKFWSHYKKIDEEQQIGSVNEVKTETRASVEENLTASIWYGAQEIDASTTTKHQILTRFEAWIGSRSRAFELWMNDNWAVILSRKLCLVTRPIFILIASLIDEIAAFGVPKIHILVWRHHRIIFLRKCSWSSNKWQNMNFNGNMSYSQTICCITARVFWSRLDFFRDLLKWRVYVNKPTRIEVLKDEMQGCVSEAPWNVCVMVLGNFISYSICNLMMCTLFFKKCFKLMPQNCFI